MQIAILIALAVLGLLCLVGTALGLPGHWVLLLLAIGVELGDVKWLPEGQDTTFGWGLIVAILVLGLIGEANQVVYGNTQDTATYPGIAAAGANINISGPFIHRIIIALVLEFVLPWLPRFETYLANAMLALAGVLVTGFGGAIYLIANLGPGPRDGLMTGLQAVASTHRACPHRS